MRILLELAYFVPRCPSLMPLLPPSCLSDTLFCRWLPVLLLDWCQFATTNYLLVLLRVWFTAAMLPAAYLLAAQSVAAPQMGGFDWYLIGTQLGAKPRHGAMQAAP